MFFASRMVRAVWRTFTIRFLIIDMTSPLRCSFIMLLSFVFVICMFRVESDLYNLLSFDRTVFIMSPYALGIVVSVIDTAARRDTNRFMEKGEKT